MSPVPLFRMIQFAWMPSTVMEADELFAWIRLRPVLTELNEAHEAESVAAPQVAGTWLSCYLWMSDSVKLLAPVSTWRSHRKSTMFCRLTRPSAEYTVAGDSAVKASLTSIVSPSTVISPEVDCRSSPSPWISTLEHRMLDCTVVMLSL
jgi:hypothetical protein